MRKSTYTWRIMLVSQSRLQKLGGLALVIGGLLFTIGNLLHPTEHSAKAHEAATWTAADVIFMAGMIGILLGLPEEDRHWLFEAVEPGFDFKGSRRSFEPDYDTAAALSRMHAYGTELIDKKRRQPADDMLSIVASAQLDDVTIPAIRPTNYVVQRGNAAKDVGVAAGVAKPKGPDQLPFGMPPAVGDALYLGFESSLERLVIRVDVDCSQARGAGVDPEDPPLKWEVSSGEAPAATH